MVKYAMLRNTFCHIPGIGPRFERRLWEAGIHTWETCLNARTVNGIPRFPKKAGTLDSIKRHLEASLIKLDEGDPVFFSRSLTAREEWRLFPEFRSSVAYIDIETNGYMGPYGYITAVSLYDGRELRYYVRGENLDDLKEDIFAYKVLVTYNGKCFDIPFIENHLGIRLEHAHIDLRFLLHDLGFKGGLKGCERLIGIERGDLKGVDGYFAVLLWKDYRKNKNPKALETLLAYNIQDVVNLEPLMITAYNLKLAKTPFEKTHLIATAAAPSLPFSPDIETIERIRATRFPQENRY